MIGQWANALIDQALGYFGDERFVLFYYDPRARKINWRDSRSCGSSHAGWPASLADFELRARSSGITLGHDQESGDHVLLVDRLEQQVCFAYREEAQEFLARRSAAAA